MVWLILWRVSMGCYKLCKLVIYCLHCSVINHALLSLKFRERIWPQRVQISAKPLAGHQMPRNWSLEAFFPRHQGWSVKHQQFDPLADLSQHKKKKPSNKLTVRPFTREVVLLPQYRGTVPRNKVWQELQQQKRIQPLKFKRSMSSLEVKNVICGGFQRINGFLSFHYLECIQNNHLAVVASQDVDGEFVSTKKGGSLYSSRLR